MTDKYKNIEENTDLGFWAYHAGMADGDGSFISRGKNYKKLRYSLNLIDKNVVDELNELYGKKTYLKKRRKEHHSDQWMTILDGEDAIHFTQMIYPYMVEKKDIVKKFAKENNFKLNNTKTGINERAGWLAGYFDAEGCIFVGKDFNKKSKNYRVINILTFTSSNLKVCRLVRAYLNKILNLFKKEKKVVAKIVKKQKRPNETKPCYDVKIYQMVKIHLFARIFYPLIKVKRKRDKFKEVMKFADFSAQFFDTYGSFNFKKNPKIKEKWLKAIETRQEEYGF